MCVEEGVEVEHNEHNTAGLWDGQEALSAELRPNAAFCASSFIEDSCSKQDF